MYYEEFMPHGAEVIHSNTLHLEIENAEKICLHEADRERCYYSKL